MKRKVLVAALVLLVIIGGAGLYFFAFQGPRCRGSASCVSGTVENIVDGDTLDVGNVRVRLTLVDSPDAGQPGHLEATQFASERCPIGSQALVDEDDGQTAGSFGRMVALVYCDGINLNADLLGTGHAILLTNFCSRSEFADDPWTGCP